MKKRGWRLLRPAAAAIAVAAAALNPRLTRRNYPVKSAKISRPVRLVLLTDLHSCAYGEGQRELLDAVEEQHPDLVLLGGDILDDDPPLPEENAWTVIEALGSSYPTFYVTGNHEFWSGRAEEIKVRIENSGVTVLEGEGRTVVFQGQPIHICGIDDPAVGTDIGQAQLSSAARGAVREGFSILLTHRPERTSAYEGQGFDLILAGHAHGGQVRMPLIGPLFAPDEGALPDYTAGTYLAGETWVVVSRGLGNGTPFPRLWNAPELVVVTMRDS